MIKIPYGVNLAVEKIGLLRRLPAAGIYYAKIIGLPHEISGNCCILKLFSIQNIKIK